MRKDIRSLIHSYRSSNLKRSWDPERSWNTERSCDPETSKDQKYHETMRSKISDLVWLPICYSKVSIAYRQTSVTPVLLL